MDVFLTGFSKKLLVALSIVVIIAMCLTPTEARSTEYKRRHKRPDNVAHPTKDSTTRTPLENKKRHQTHRRQESMAQLRKARRPKNNQTDIYYSVTKQIVTMLKNTRRFFNNEDKKLLGLDEKYKNTIPSWLPTVNFVEIHYHDHRSNRSRKNGSTIPERKFMYIMPKLYKSLIEYEQIFKHLLNAELIFPDDPYTSYKRKRKQAIQNSLHKLFSTIQEVSIGWQHVGGNLTMLTSTKNKLDLSTLEKTMNWTQCIENDILAFRGYGNLLNNWFLEFRCKGKQLNRKACKKFEEKLQKKLVEKMQQHKVSSRRNNRSR